MVGFVRPSISQFKISLEIIPIPFFPFALHSGSVNCQERNLFLYSLELKAAAGTCPSSAAAATAASSTSAKMTDGH